MLGVEGSWCVSGVVDVLFTVRIEQSTKPHVVHSVLPSTTTKAVSSAIAGSISSSVKYSRLSYRVRKHY